MSDCSFLNDGIVILTAPPEMIDIISNGYKSGNMRAVGDLYLPSMRAQGITALILPLWIGGKEAADNLMETMKLASALHAETAEEGSGILLVRNGDDIRLAKSTGQIALILAARDAGVLEDAPEMLNLFYQIGARIVCLAGIAAQARLAALAHELNMVLNIGVGELTEYLPKTRPYLASCYINEGERIPVEDIASTASHGGLICMGDSALWAGDSKQAADHILDFTRIAGAGKVCLRFGCDKNLRLTPGKLASALFSAGLSKEEIQDIFGLNILRLLDRVLT